jgi:hypothetical protein
MLAAPGPGDVVTVMRIDPPRAQLPRGHEYDFETVTT